MGDWITGLIEDYKYVNGTHFGERKHWLHDDYVKFIRMSEHLIEKNGEGVLGFITNHGYLDNPTFRGMRWHLLNTFDSIYVLDLHGNAKKEEVTPEGAPDKNVFDIQQGVAIIIAVKTRQKIKGMAKVWHRDLWGARESKYDALASGTLGNTLTELIECSAPQYTFAVRDEALADEYQEGFGLAEFMPTNVTGIVTMGDGFAVAEDAGALRKNMDSFLNQPHTEASLRAEFKLGKNYASWILPNRAELASSELNAVDLAYRPFDTRMTYFDNRVLWRWRYKVMRHMLGKTNFALMSCRQSAVRSWEHVFVADRIVDDSYVSNRTKERGYCFPLYLDPEEQDLDQIRRINFDPKLHKQLITKADHSKYGKPTPEDIFDYIYAVLHCPAYRKTYAEVLKSDFPRIPWPKTPDAFWELVPKGTALRRLHLMEPDAIGDTPYPFDGEGDSVVDKVVWKDGMVMINKTQGFAGVPQLAWEFFIGGYQPAQKWLKDRKCRELSFDDLQHYQRIIKILSETDRIMKTIEMDLS